MEFFITLMLFVLPLCAWGLWVSQRGGTQSRRKSLRQDDLKQP